MNGTVASHSPSSPPSSNAEEVSFAFDELFFSRTDERGIILAGNSVFQRISMYAWEELLHKPHNLIRHQDMPKAVFWLLWETIKSGQPIGAYVKNRAKDGRYYWVFAIVTPIDGGYLSVRLKPSSPVFKVVEAEYQALRALELRDKLKPAESAALLLERLTQLGFRDYWEFLATALSHEITARDTALQRPKNLAIELFQDLMQSSKSLMERAQDIFKAYSINEHVPLNLRIQAAQLGDSGSTIGVISNNYSIISSEIRAGMNHFVSSAAQVSKTIHDGLFLIATAAIQHEVAEFFKQEAEDNHDDSKTKEMGYLEHQLATYQHKAMDGLREIAHHTEQFQQSCQEMNRLATGLGVTRIMGKVESARLTVAKDGLDELIEDLERFQTTISSGLKEIGQMNLNIRANTEQLIKTAQKQATAP